MKKKIKKPFDIQAAKNGAKIETKSGHPVRIVCYDRKGDYSIIALVDYGLTEELTSYTIDGKYIDDKFADNSLIIIEEVEYPDFKFNIGDYIVNTSCLDYKYKVMYLDTMYHTYHLVCINDNNFTYQDIECIDKNFHKWTLKDAEPGDVLVCEDDNCPFIFKEYRGGTPSAYCGIDTNDSIRISSGRNNWTVDPIRPATYDEMQQFFNRLAEEGYKWDAKSLTLSKIQKRWRDDENVQIDGYYINGVSQIVFRPGYNRCCYDNTFATEKHAKSALAMAKISQIMKNDERFGGRITDEEWCAIHLKKFVIKKLTGRIVLDTASLAYNFLAFHTKKQAKLFLKENEDLVKDYYMMD